MTSDAVKDIVYDGRPLVIDNFLFDEEVERLQNKIIFNLTFPFYLTSQVTTKQIDDGANHWEWMGSNIIYQEDRKDIGYDIQLYDMIWRIFAPRIEFEKLLRVKANFYPYTNTIKEHAQHIDYDFSHAGAIFCLNTCDGFTRIGDEKIDSVQNRMIFFDSSKLHNSSTTTNAKGRFNINFNFI